MNGLSCGEESMTICSAVLIQYQRVTDGRTDRRTDRIGIAKTCFSIADARKKRPSVQSTRECSPMFVIAVNISGKCTICRQCRVCSIFHQHTLSIVVFQLSFMFGRYSEILLSVRLYAAQVSLSEKK